MRDRRAGAALGLIHEYERLALLAGTSIAVVTHGHTRLTHIANRLLTVAMSECHLQKCSSSQFFLLCEFIFMIIKQIYLSDSIL